MICALIASTGWAQQADYVSGLCQGYQSNTYLSAVVECSQNPSPDAYPSLSASKVKTATIVIFILALVIVLIVFLIHIFAWLRKRKSWRVATRIVGWSWRDSYFTSPCSTLRLLLFYWWSVCSFSPSPSLPSSGKWNYPLSSVLVIHRTPISLHRMAPGKLRRVPLVQPPSVIDSLLICSLNLSGFLGIRPYRIGLAADRCNLSFSPDWLTTEATSTPSKEIDQCDILDRSTFSWCSFVFLIYIQRKRKKSKEKARRKRRQSAIVFRIWFFVSLWRSVSLR